MIVIIYQQIGMKTCYKTFKLNKHDVLSITRNNYLNYQFLLVGVYYIIQQTSILKPPHN